MDASQYKDYILVLLFMKYVSDKYAGKKNALIHVPKGGSFDDMVSLKGKKEIGDGINKVIGKLAKANELAGVIDVADFNDSDKLGKGQSMQDRLTRLIAIFEDEKLDFKKNRAEGDDLLGDAYEYLMRNFATESGKSKGQFYTPAEVSRVIAKIIGIRNSKSAKETLYDPTCGSGSLLLKAADEAPVHVTIYGQEKDVANTAMARMNMILHGHPEAEIHNDDTLAAPHYTDKSGGLKKFDYVVANPPFSTKSWSSGFKPSQDIYNRFEYGLPPEKNGDYAFLLHILSSLKSTGTGAVILPHGVLFRGHAEADIRRELVRRGFIKGIIGLPANLFYGTGIPAAIIILDKEEAASRKGVFLIDASRGYYKDGNKNRLRSRDIHYIVDTFNQMADLPGYSRLVPLSEIEETDFNLNIPRYIDSSAREDLHSIEAHLHGGIPGYDVEGLAAYWEEFPGIRDALFQNGKRRDFYTLKVDGSEVKSTIYSHGDFEDYQKRVLDRFHNWKKKESARLKSLDAGCNPKEEIYRISEDLLSTFRGIPPLDAYEVYQSLMNYWDESMQDDLYMISEDGWNVPIVLEKDKNGKVKDWDSDLLPKDQAAAHFFAGQVKEIEDLNDELSEIDRKKEEMTEEHGGEEGLLSEVLGDNGKVSKPLVGRRIKEIGNHAEFADEKKVLVEYADLLEQETSLKDKLKNAESSLDESLKEKFGKLKTDEVKALVVDHRWMARIQSDLLELVERISHTLAGRVKELSDRYARTLPELESQVDELSEKVEGHLKKMGFAV